MFFIDGEKLDMREEASNPHVKKIKDGMTFLWRKWDYPLRLIPNFLVKADSDNPGKMVYPMPFTLQLVDFVDGTEWRWCKSFSYDEHRNAAYTPTSLEIERISRSENRGIGNSFLLYFISSRCLDGENKNTVHVGRHQQGSPYIRR